MAPVSEGAPPPRRDLLRAQSEALQLRSRELRTRSAAVLLRREAVAQRLELRRELLQSTAQMRALEQSVDVPEDDDEGLQEWLADEVMRMIASGWDRRELEEVGIGPALLRELRLESHPALRPDGRTRGPGRDAAVPSLP